MLAQRQRELYSFQHRQRQLLQQKVMLMRQGIASSPTGAVGTVGTARVPKSAPTTPQQQQQFNFSQGYSPMTGNPPTSPSHFNSMSGGSLDSKLSGRVPLNNQTLVGGVQGQFSSAVNSSLQQGLFRQFGGPGEFKENVFHSHLIEDCNSNNSQYSHMRSSLFSSMKNTIVLSDIKKLISYSYGIILPAECLFLCSSTGHKNS